MVDTYTRRIGNIFAGENKKGGKKGAAGADDTVVISLSSMAESSQIVLTNAGRKAEIRLRHGVALRHGDILEGSDPAAKTARKRTLVVKQAMEKVVVVRFLERNNDGYDYYDSDFYDVPLLVGHAVGCMRRTLSFFDDDLQDYGVMGVSFPVRDDKELRDFKRMLKPVLKYIKITTTEQVFIPDEDACISKSI